MTGKSFEEFFLKNVFIVCTIGLVITFFTVFLSRRALGWLVGKEVLIAQSLSKGKNIEGEFFVKTPSGNTLSTIEIQPSIGDDAFKFFDKYIIAFSPNAKSFSNLMLKYKWLANVTQANVIGFDYPNVGNSTGWVYSQDSLVEAGIAQVQNLLDKGVLEHNIFLYGFSLGGAISTMVAGEYAKRNIVISVISDRSFSTLGNMVAGLCGLSCLKVLFNPLCYLLNWDLNAICAYKRLPEKNKMLIFSKKDEVIHPKIASVFSGLKSDLKIQHQYNLSKDKYKSAKKRCSTNSILNGTAHNASLAELKDCNDEPIIEHINYFIQKERAR